MIVQRTEKHIIKKNNPYYNMLDDYCFKSKNLYNHANYLIRQEFCKTGKWLRYNELDKILKNDLEYPDYKNMPSAVSAQQTLRLLDSVWCSFFKNIKKWSKHKDLYLGKPHLPKYKSKNSRQILILTYSGAKLKNNIIYFHKTFNGFKIKTKCVEYKDFISLQQVRFIPKNNYIITEVIYKINIPEIISNNNRYLSIDIGVDNLATITNNIGNKPIIINGKGLKSINQYYNKQISYYQKIIKQMNNLDYSNRMYLITNKRNFKINDYLHKASRYIINYAKRNNISIIIIGKNNNWKQNSKLSKKINQNFIGIPFLMFINQIIYKAQEYGIQVILTEESYTSGTSFLDNELPIKENYNKSRRIHRGLFKSNSNKLINSDVNGSYQIMKKVFPNAFANGIEGVALHPLVVNI